MDDYDVAWKFIIGGQERVGKSTLLHRFVHNEFTADMKMTVGVQFHTMIVKRYDKRINLVLWDLGGQKQFRFMHDAYLRGAFGAFVCFDLTSFVSLESTKDWINMYRKVIPNVPILLVGTKLDLIDADDCKPIFAAANKLTVEKNLNGFVQTSSKEGTNVDVAIYSMVGFVADGLKEDI